MIATELAELRSFEAEFSAPESSVARESQRFEPVPVPDFELEDMDGGMYSMEARKGKVVVINFWATWCGPCRFEIPELVELQEEYGPEGFEVLGISMDEGGFEVIRPFAQEMAINYPIVVDHGPVASQFGGIYGLPTTFIVDRNGLIQERIIGLVTRRSLEPRLADPAIGAGVSERSRRRSDHDQTSDDTLLDTPRGTSAVPRPPDELPPAGRSRGESLLHECHLTRRREAAGVDAVEVESGSHASRIPRSSMNACLEVPVYQPCNLAARHVIDRQAHVGSLRDCEADRRRRIERIRIVLVEQE
jgi:thiol-disulfide isomerase/thioredoxin